MGEPSRRKRQHIDCSADELFSRLEEGLADKAEARRRALSIQYIIFITFMSALFVAMFPIIFVYDSFDGNKTHEPKRDRKTFDEYNSVLQDYVFRQMFRMSRPVFDRLFNMLEPDLNKKFFPKGGGKRDPSKSKYLIDTKVRLAIAIRYFAGASPYDLMQIYNVSLASVFISVWGVIDMINAYEGLKYKFPTHEEKEVIAKAFACKSKAMFDCVIGAIDGLLMDIDAEPSYLQMAEYWAS